MRLSYSLYGTYMECPIKYRFKYIMGLREDVKPAAMQRGSDIHERIERIVRGHNLPMPWDADKPMSKVPADGAEHPLNGVVLRYRNWPNGDRHCERKLGFDAEWYPFPQDADGCAYVVVFDLAAYKDGVLEIAEWKTGKPYDSHADQRSLYALAGLRTWRPKKVQVTTYYVDRTSDARRLTAPAEAEQQLIDLWTQRRDTIINDKVLAPRPNDKCKWCHFRKSNGGPCPMNY